jgi:hypothetical protein
MEDEHVEHIYCIDTNGHRWFFTSVVETQGCTAELHEHGIPYSFRVISCDLGKGIDGVCHTLNYCAGDFVKTETHVKEFPFD